MYILCDGRCIQGTVGCLNAPEGGMDWSSFTYDLWLLLEKKKKKKNINRERSPRIKGCKDCNTLFFSNNRRPHFQYTERNYSFQAFNSVLPSNCHPRAKRYTTLTGGDSALQTHSTSARARSEDAQERQANEPGELYPFCFRKRKS